MPFFTHFLEGKDKSHKANVDCFLRLFGLVYMIIQFHFSLLTDLFQFLFDKIDSRSFYKFGDSRLEKRLQSYNVPIQRLRSYFPNKTSSAA